VTDASPSTDKPRTLWARLGPKLDPIAHPLSNSRLWNLPNGLTMLRCVMVIPFAWLLFFEPQTDANRYWEAGIFAVASFTDFADGWLARRWDLVTSFGKIADPIADKALTGVALIGLSYQNALPWWVTIVMLIREIAVTLLRFWVIRHGVIAASRGGKAKTVFQILAILLYLLPLTGFLASARAWIMGIALILAIVTGIDYLARAINVRKNSDRTAARQVARAAGDA